MKPMSAVSGPASGRASASPPTRDGSSWARSDRSGSARATVSNVVIYTAVVSIENPHLELLPGMTANLRIETHAREGVTRVPNAALRWRPAGAAAADDHGQRVYVLNQRRTPSGAHQARRHGRESHRDRLGSGSTRSHHRRSQSC